MSETKNQAIDKLNNGNLEDLFDEIEGIKVRPIQGKTRAELYGNDYWLNKLLGF